MSISESLLASANAIKQKALQAAEEGTTYAKKYLSSVGSGGGSTTAPNYVAENKLSDVFGDGNAGNSKKVILLHTLQMVQGMPPMGDNIADPPFFTTDSTNGIGRELGSFNSGMCGMEYVNRCIQGGQFLMLTPLDIDINLTGATGEKLKSTAEGAINGLIGRTSATLTNIENRLNIANYGIEVKLATNRYEKTYFMLMKTVLMSLGIGEGADGAYTDDYLQGALPPHIYERFIKNTQGNGSPGAYRESIIKPLLETGDSSDVSHTDDSSTITSDGYQNFLRYASNIDASQDLINLPVQTFYLNGPPQKSYSMNSSTEESKVAAATNNVLGNFAKKGMTEAAGSVGNSTVDYAEEIAYHGSTNGASLTSIFARAVIPKVISSTASDFTYNLRVTEVSSGSDPLSLIRVQDTYCKLMPYVTSVSRQKKAVVVPNAPLYCAAFVKGVMNVPRGVITSLTIDTKPEFQTSDGIPTLIDFNITIQPLMAITTMPDFGGYFTRSDDASLVAQMYNPTSVFNTIATMCGQNTVYTKYPYGMWQYYVSGKLSSFYQSVKGTARHLTTMKNDWVNTKISKWSTSHYVR